MSFRILFSVYEFKFILSVLNLITGSQSRDLSSIWNFEAKKRKERKERSWPENHLEIVLENNFLEFILDIIIIDSNLMNGADF